MNNGSLLLFKTVEPLVVEPLQPDSPPREPSFGRRVNDG